MPIPAKPTVSGDNNAWGGKLNTYLDSLTPKTDGKIIKNVGGALVEVAVADEVAAAPAVAAVTPDTLDQGRLAYTGITVAKKTFREAFLNDRNDIDATGATDMGATITAYLAEFATRKIHTIYCENPSVYKVGSTITVPRALVLEGPLRKGQTTYPDTLANVAQFKPAASNLTMFQLAGNGSGLRGLNLRIGRSDGYSTVVGVTASAGVEQFIEHCYFQSGETDSTAVQLFDMLYFTFSDNSLADLYGYGLTANGAALYYGINVGTIQRNLFSGRIGAFQASGIFSLRDNDFEGGSGMVGPAVTIGQAAKHTDAILEGNYFEMSGASLGILVTDDSRIAMRRNDVYGASASVVGSYGLKFDAASSYREVVSNVFNNLETGIIRTALNATTGGELLGPNRYSAVTFPITTIGAVPRGAQISGANVRPSLQIGGDNRITYESALTGGEVIYSVSADFTVDLQKGNIIHITPTVDVTASLTNYPSAGQIVLLANMGPGTVTLPVASWLTRENTDAKLRPGEVRLFACSHSGYSGGTKPREMGPRAVAPVVKTSTFTADVTADVYLCDATAGAITANLPSATTWAAGPITIKKTDANANAVTVDPNGTQTIDGATTLALTTQWSAVTVRPSGGNWLVTSRA